MASTYEELMAKSRELYAAGDRAGARRLAEIALTRRAASSSPQYAANGVPMNDAARAELAARAQSGDLQLSPQRVAQQAGIDSPVEQAISGTATTGLEQFGSGANTGMASAFGFPIDSVTGVINSATGGVNSVTGSNIGRIERPFGGSQQLHEDVFGRFSTDVAPQTGLQRGLRRVGEEVGASAAMAPLGAFSSTVRASPMAAAAVEGAAALGSGTGAAIANEIAPNSAVADIVGALVGGIPTGMAASRALGMGGSDAVIRNGIEDQRQRAASAYDDVRADRRSLPQNSVDSLTLGVSGRMDAERLNPRLQPGSAAILDALLQDSAGPMRIEDVEDLRRLTQQGLPATASPSDRRLSTIMTSEITDYLDNLGDPVADRLREGRDAHRRASAAQLIADAETRAARRAASTGSGGNEINAMRQNLRSILDNPRKTRSFNPAELAQMSEIVSGTSGQNIMRRLSRIAPSSGGLSSMLGIGGTLASPGVALPIMAVTEAAKAFGEGSTRKSIAALLQSLAPNRVLSTGQQGIDPIIAALLAARTTANDR